MPTGPRITVVIPHLDDEAGLRRCLESLADQRERFPSFDVIVVDNGSRALPRDVCAAFDYVRLEKETTPGPGPARSHGAHLARGAILAFIDADCIADPDWLATITTHLDAHPETSVIGGDVRIAHVDPERLTAIEAYESVYGYRMRLYVERDHYTATLNMAVRHETFEQVGDFGSLSVAEDMDWGRRATAMGIRIEYVADMKIATPARTSFAELQRKWDRHIGHDFAEVSDLQSRVRWAARALSLLASPFVELRTVATTPRVVGLRERSLAYACAVRLRMYRARRMMGLLGRGSPERLSARWRAG